MLSKGTRYLLAAVQAILGYEWLISGTNKVLSGTFPQGLADALGDGLKGNPNGWYVNVIDRVVLPHGVLFGTLIEFCELLAGVALLVGALALCGPLPLRGERLHRLAAFELGAATLAGLGCALLCVNFHFWMGDGLISAVNTGNAFGEGIDLDTLMPPLALLIAALNARLLLAVTGHDGVLRLLHPFARRAPRVETAPAASTPAVPA